MTNYLSPDELYFDRFAEISMTEQGRLPHWSQGNKLIFLTFRLGDSLPQEVLKELRDKKELFIRTHPRPWDESILAQYSREIGGLCERWLDNGYGKCLLRNSEARSLLEEVISYFEGKLFETISYVIMPNHVHILFVLLGDNSISKIVHALKRNSSIKLNRYFGPQGKIWMREYYDRIIRSESHMNYCIDYIRRNPVGLPSSDFTLVIK